MSPVCQGARILAVGLASAHSEPKRAKVRGREATLLVSRISHVYGGGHRQSCTCQEKGPDVG